jgi:hypothetical protein
MYDIRPVTHTRRCRCGAKVTVTGTIGPSNICDRCADRLLAVIWGGSWPAMKAHLDGLGRFTYPGSDLPAGRDQRRPRDRRRAARPSPPAR